MCIGNSSNEHGNWTGTGYGESDRGRNCTDGEGSSSLSSSSSSSSASSIVELYYTPEWDAIHTNVRWIFLLHNYGFACLFFFLAFYAFFSILNLRAQISTRPYMSTINGFLCLLGLSRAAELFIDPYGLMKVMPAFMGTLLWDLGFPCLVSSFSLIQIAFLQLTQVEIGPEKLRKKTCLSVTVTIHFVTVIASAICSTFNASLIQMKLVTQLLFALWGLFLCGSFLHAGKRVMGLLGNPGGSSNDGSSVGSGSSKGLIGMGMGLLAPGQNIAASLTAALAPTLLQSNAPKIKITDENDRTVSVASDSSRLNDNAEPSSSGGNSNTRPLTPIPTASASTSASSSSKSANSTGSPAGGEPSNSISHGRPPSPVLPRRKSAGQALRTSSCPPGGERGSTGQSVTLSTSGRRVSLNNRRGSGYVDEKEAHRKKSLTWSEGDVNNGAGGSKGKSLEKGVEKPLLTGGSGDRKRRQSRKSFDNSVETAPARSEGVSVCGGGESLLSGGGPDYTLQSILSHIAYVNQTALDYRLSRKLSRKCQVQRVLKFTSITAILGVLLCVAEIVRIMSPYGLIVTSSRPGLWPWFVLQTISRSLEFAMGATIANITKQPVNRPHPYAYSMRHKAHRESLYL